MLSLGLYASVNSEEKSEPKDMMYFAVELIVREGCHCKLFIGQSREITLRYVSLPLYQFSEQTNENSWSQIYTFGGHLEKTN